jgi:ComF family protein
MNFLPEVLNWYRCYLCNSGSELLCDKCFSKLEKINYSEEILGYTLKSLYEYNQFSSKILLLAKYPPFYFHILKLLIWKSQLYLYPKNTVFCPVPLSSLKMFERKFNQAEVIANEIAKSSKGEVFSILKRIRDSKPLFNLNKFSRKKEMGGVFRVSFCGSILPQKETLKIVLVDDLVTTGETIKDCIRALKSIGFKNIEVFSLFRA